MIRNMHTACKHFCNMKTLYLRNVPDDVVHRLERMARVDAMSVSAVAIRELAAASRQVDNAALFGSFSDIHLPPTDLIIDPGESRSTR